jgi:hypothetical protein
VFPIAVDRRNLEGKDNSFVICMGLSYNGKIRMWKQQIRTLAMNIVPKKRERSSGGVRQSA